MTTKLPNRSATAEPEPIARLRPRLVGAQITLRPLVPDDLEAIFEAAYASRHEIAPWLPWCTADYRREDSAAYLASRPAAWEQREEFSYAIIDNAAGRLLGSCGINQLDWLHLKANLGYWVRTDATGRGIATAAVRLLAPAALEDLDLERVEIWAALDNVASRRVAEKSGAQLECICRRRLHNRGQQQDAAGYSFIREDFSLPRRRGC